MLDRQETGATISDRDLIARIGEGDRRAFELLVERHAATVLRLATAMSDPSTAEDAMQQTFLNVYQHAASFRGDASARSGASTISARAGRPGNRMQNSDGQEKKNVADTASRAGAMALIQSTLLPPRPGHDFSPNL